MKTILIAAAASLALAGTAAPVLSATTEAAADAKVCVSDETKAAWKMGDPSPYIVQSNTVAGQKAYCAGLKTAAGHYAGATAARDNEGAVGAPSGTTGTQTPNVTDTNSAAGMTTTTDPNAKPGD